MSAAYVLLSGSIDQHRTETIARIVSDLWLHGCAELHLAINSPGGTTMEGHAMANLLRTFNLRLVTYNVGRVESAAILPYLVADDRVSTRDSTFMIHPPSAHLNNQFRVADLERVTVGQRETEEAYLTAVRSRCHLPPAIDSAISRHEAYLSSEEAIAGGMATRIGQFEVPPGVRLHVVGSQL